MACGDDDIGKNFRNDMLPNETALPEPVPWSDLTGAELPEHRNTLKDFTQSSEKCP